jgi:AmpE protein
MVFLAVLLAVVVWQGLGAKNPLQRDAWLLKPLARLTLPTGLQGILVLGFVLLLCAPLGYLDYLGRQSWWWLWLPLATGFLLYSLGRVEFADTLERYSAASRQQQWEEALAQYQRIGGSLKPGTDDWSALHSAMLQQAGYRGFERLFAVLFWFVLAGPAGALAYRLLALVQEHQPSSWVARILWIMEWPAVRVVGLTFAFTGNFVGCFQHWQQHALCFKSTTERVMMQNVLGALSVSDEPSQTPEISRRELVAMERLLGRSLWFWLGALAIFALQG